MNNCVRIKRVIETGFNGANHVNFIEVDKAWWYSISEQEQQDYLEEAAVSYLNDMVNCCAWVEEE